MEGIAAVIFKMSGYKYHQRGDKNNKVRGIRGFKISKEGKGKRCT